MSLLGVQGHHAFELRRSHILKHGEGIHNSLLCVREFVVLGIALMQRFVGFLDDIEDADAIANYGFLGCWIFVGLDVCHQLFHALQ